jgi:glutathione S-transferase
MGSDYARPVPAKLYVVHGSHPCATVQRALELKGIDHKVVELMPPMHAAIQRARFGQRTVPGIKFEDGEKVVGSRAILRRLDTLVPDPPLLPADTERRAKVEDAERWGDEVLQPMARRLVWLGMRRRPASIVSFGEHSKLPVPDVMAKLSAPMISRVEWRLNDVSEDAVRDDLAALPGHLDRVDGWIAEGVIGGEEVNAADLQLAPTIRLMMVVGDARPLIEGRPAAELAMRLFPQWDGDIPAGALPQPASAPAPAAAHTA